MARAWQRVILASIWALWALPSHALPDLCDDAARQAARETGVPLAVLMAIARVETGRTRQGRVEPWPWTTNTEGVGQWFDTREAAVTQARAAIARGQTSIDLGCFQVNWRWHGQHFAGPEALFHPLTAARYAAGLLARFHAELGSWERAAGAYHSRNPAPNARYRARFAQVMADLADSTQALAPSDPRAQARPATRAQIREPQPLIAGTASGASLVPALSGAGRPFLSIAP